MCALLCLISRIYHEYRSKHIGTYLFVKKYASFQLFNGEIVDQLPFHRQKFNIFTRLVLLSPLGKQQLRAQLITHESFMSRDRVIFNRKGFTEVQCIIRTSWCANSKEVKLRLIIILSIFNAIWHIDFKYLRFFVSILFAKLYTL